MRFEFYHAGLEKVPKLSVDGTVSNSIHFSHWNGNETPTEVKADTSTEIALNLVASPNKRKLTQGIDLVTNNHFDTDGVLSVWTVLMGERALELREQLIAAAEVGDFSEFTSENAIRASIAIQGPEQASSNSDSGSPLAAFLAGEPVDDDARAYELVLPAVEQVLTRTDDYEQLWRKGWEQIARAIESFEHGASRVEEYPDGGLSVILLDPQAFGASGFDPKQNTAPFTAISRFARGQLFLVVNPYRNGWAYRIDYPYYSWAETIVRPRIVRRDLGQLLERLNELEQNFAGSWRTDTTEMTSAAKFLDQEGNLTPSSIPPDQIGKILSKELLRREVSVKGA